ncbi:hypothetical protein BMS3Abin05_01127 [bacterium BMS3Abin05]|nr:hypothetical protein BMS3Abin05_01127 [bacterium BMS3Abin05]
MKVSKMRVYTHCPRSMQFSHGCFGVITQTVRFKACPNAPRSMEPFNCGSIAAPGAVNTKRSFKYGMPGSTYSINAILFANTAV